MTRVSPRTGTRVVCMCRDCQTYAHWLDRADDILDANGGTEVFQLTPAQVEISSGHEHIRCMRLSPKGPMRWYTGCCRTPIGNTLDSPRMPFWGLPTLFVAASNDERDAALGPVRGRLFAGQGVPPIPEDGHERIPPALMFRTARLLARGFVLGAHRPSPVFDAEGTPLVEPTVLTREQRREAQACCATKTA